MALTLCVLLSFAALAERGAAMGDGVWMAGTFGACTSACDPPIKEREVKCVEFWTGENTHACGHIDPPEATMECDCEHEAVCVDTAPSDGCPAAYYYLYYYYYHSAPEEHTPGLPGAMPSLLFSFVGCFGLARDDSSDGEFLDETCLTYSGEGKCRSGLPFFTNDTATTAEACSEFCVGKGMDIFGLVDGAACRCGASEINKEVWHESDPVPKLEFDGDLPDVDGNDCPLEVYRYTGSYNLGGIPLGLLKPMVTTTAYIDGIVKGEMKNPLEEEDIMYAELAQLKQKLAQNLYP